MKKFSEYLEAAQENKELEVQNEGILASLGILGVGALGWLYLYTKACVVGWDYARVTIPDMIQGIKEIFGGKTRSEKIQKEIDTLLFGNSVELFKKGIWEDFNFSEEEEDEFYSESSKIKKIQLKKLYNMINDTANKEILKNKIKENFEQIIKKVPEKFKNFFKNSPDSK
jgi:hypothetical protein